MDNLQSPRGQPLSCNFETRQRIFAYALGVSSTASVVVQDIIPVNVQRSNVTVFNARKRMYCKIMKCISMIQENSVFRLLHRDCLQGLTPFNNFRVCFHLRFKLSE